MPSLIRFPGWRASSGNPWTADLRALLLAELERWIELRWGHAADKKVRTDRNQIKDFADFAGNRPADNIAIRISKASRTCWRAFLPTIARTHASGTCHDMRQPNTMNGCPQTDAMRH